MKDINPVIPQEEQEELFNSLNSRHKNLITTIVSIDISFREYHWEK